MKTIKGEFFKVILSLFTLASLPFLLSSCGSKSNDPGSAILKFSTATATYSEDKGAVNIPVALSAAQSNDVIVNYTWSSTDTTTYLGGDFSFLTPSSFTIKAGQTTGNIQIQIVDDTQIDPDDNVTFLLTNVSQGSAKLSTVTSEISFNLVITNNDFITANVLQNDLTWHTTATGNVNDVNLDLYLLQNVVYDANSGTITDPGTPYASSKNTVGYESLYLKSTDKDQEYFLVVNYTTGSSPLTYVLTLNGFNYTNISAAGKLTTADSGYGIFYGPFTKSGASFGRLSPLRLYRVDRSLLKGLK